MGMNAAHEKTILVADDDEPMRELLSIALEQARYRVIMARDGAEALETVRRIRPDLILLDAEMPKVNGYDVCQQLKGDPSTSGITILFLTAKTLAHERARGFAVGADGYISKPFSPRMLVQTLKEHLEGGAPT